MGKAEVLPTIPNAQARFEEGAGLAARVTLLERQIELIGKRLDGVDTRLWFVEDWKTKTAK